MQRAILTILLATLCASCGDNPRLVLPPVELTVCAGEPAAPNLPEVDWSSVETARPIQQQRDLMMMAFALDMRSAWGSCSAKVEGYKAWRDTAGD